MKFSWKNIKNWRSPENDFCLVFWFLVIGLFKKNFFGFSVWKKPRRFIWGSIYSCTMDGFFRISKKAVSELICTRLYLCIMKHAHETQWCRNRGGQRGHWSPPPNIWQISQPFSNRGRQIIPTYYYWHPQCFSPSGITAYVNYKV